MWRQSVGTGFSSVSVVGNRVVTMGNQNEKDTVWCLDATSGEVLWKHSYNCPLDPLYYEGGPGGTPTIHDGSVYTLSKKGHAFRLDLETGEIIWQRVLIKDHEFALPEWSFACSPFIVNDKVLLNVGRPGVALSLKNGETLWMSSTETSGYATAVPYHNQHLLFSAKALIAIDADTGKTAWQYPWKSSRDVNAADPIVVDNQIIVSSSANTSLLQLVDGKPEEQWKQRDLKWYFNPGVVIDGYVYSLNGTTHRPTELVCTDLKTGDTVWSKEGYGSGGVVAADDIVIVFDQGELLLFKASPEKFESLHRQKVLEGKCWTAPAIANGKIYCRNAAGDLACVDVRTP
ncbi:MAG: PQQ-like beta-propeller repeat protein [Verrucomicrobiales bacterium]|nr:PQQ-like beta-propeller repeat protein [Verrucomicrobiales bacterium]